MSKSKQKSKKSNAHQISHSALHQPAQASTSAALTSFSSAYYAHVSLALDSHTVRIFDIASNRCVNRWAAADEQNEKVGAIAWVEIASPVSEELERKRSKKRSRKSGPANGTEEAAASSPRKAESKSEKHSVLALGLSDGSILFLHPTNAGVLKRLTGPSPSSPITSLSYSHEEANLLWSISASGQIQCWSLPTSDGTGGSVTGRIPALGNGWSTLAVAYTNEQDEVAHRKALLLVGKHNIKVIATNLPSPGIHDGDLVPRTLATCTGHPSAITNLQWIGSSTLSTLSFLSIAATDRTVHLWTSKVTSVSKEAEASLIATFGLDSPAHKAIVHTASSASVELAVISETGTVAVASISSHLLAQPDKVNGLAKSAPRSKVITLRALAEIQPSVTGSSDSFCDLRPVAGSSGQIQLARSGIKPTFDTITYRTAGEYAGTIQATKPAKGKGVLFDTEDQDEVMGAPPQRTRPKTSAAAVQSSSTLSAEAPQESETAKDMGDIDVDMAEPTLADRLKSLAVNKNASKATIAGETTGTSLLPVPTASLTQSLVQALHSNDTRLLESCLVHSKEKIIKTTVKRLPSHLVLPLVEALVDRLGRTKRGYGVGSGGVHASRGKALIEWMRAVLVLHIAHLITVPNLVSRLSALQATIESRLELHTPLLALSGRLELVCSQIELRKETAAAQQAKLASSRSQKTLHIVEGEDSDSGDEQMAADQGSGVESDDEGSIEDVGLGSRPQLDSESDEEEGDDVEGLLDLEASESGSGDEPEEDFHTESEGDISDLIADDSEESGSDSEEE